MVKAYLRYEPAISFGVIASPDGNITYDPSGRHLLAPALEKISIWDLKKGLSTKTFAPSTSRASHALAVTSVASSSSPSTSIASGHADGSIRLWDCERGTCEATLNGHKSAVTVLQYNPAGSFLASGGKDCDIIIWDVIGEAGLFRLRGHRDQVTDLVFIDSGKKLVTCSKDKFLRVWDLETQHCLQIVGGHRSEIWSLDVDPKGRFLVCGSADPELRFYHIRQEAGEEAENWSKWDVLKPFGEIQRQGKDRVATLRFNSLGSLLACQVAGRTVEIYRVLDETEAVRKAKRRINRKKKDKSLAKESTEGDLNGTIVDPVPSMEVTVSDVFKVLHVLRASKKIVSIAFSPLPSPKDSLASLSLSLNNNMLETYLIDANKASKIYSIELPGHRSVIRSVTLNPEGNLLLSTSHNAVKIWNPSTGMCLRTIESGYGLCSAFVPGNRYALVGTRTGSLEIVDVGSGTTIEGVEAHTGQIKSIVPIPDEDGSVSGNGFVTGADDNDVKFWEYQLVQRPGHDSKQLSVTNVRTLKMDDSVVSLCVSPDGKYVAVALLGDNKVKVFYLDTLKLFLSLHGHSLPVFCMDISSDGDLIVTGSADKTLKIWGLDFGDIHKTIFAHADSVMDVKFVKNTHYVFSVGKDRLVKYWDADKFELLLTLEGHHAEIWCLTVSSRGDFIVTGSHDRSIRRWDRTEEPFFLEEEKEKRLEEMFESDLDNADNRYAPPESVPEEGSVGLAGKKTKETVTATDAIIDALDTAEEETKRIEQQKEEERNGKGGVFQPNVLMRGMSPSEYVLHSVSSVPTNDLEQTLLALPFSDALKLMSYLKEWALIPGQVELVSRICTGLVQIHHNQLSATPSARPLLTTLKDTFYQRVKDCKDTIGFNLAAMDYIKELLVMKSDAPFRDADAKLKEIRMLLSKRADPTQVTERRKKKRQKTSAETQIKA
ncbi:hypothetical protein LUZ63_010583 [Rhynchospora breviuscula]|uniref:Small-subunit processome Utp12 domain-containing protein n=1 Tax=Rhynchospora breviuscula TaxID=2022672 RepID=A0A9Q0HQ57_9POAL|nr:hypothetical protein LUZ63_010583 [Rhynchospora breviuscula]